MGRLKASQKRTKRAAFLRGGDVERAGQGPGLVGHHAYRHGRRRGQRGDELGGPAGPELEQVPVVGDGPQHVAHVIGRRGGWWARGRAARAWRRSAGSALGSGEGPTSVWSGR